jgi:hypothetical protein
MIVTRTAPATRADGGLALAVSRIVNPLLATLLGALLWKIQGALVGLALGLLFVFRARVWTSLASPASEALVRFLGYFPRPLLSLLSRRRTP